MAQPNSLPAVPETIITSRRKHWINILPIFVSTALLVLFLLGISYLYGVNDSVRRVIPGSIASSAALIYLALVATIAFLAIWIWRQNRLVLTNHHLVEYTRRGVFNHSVSQFSLIKLQDVSASQRGFLANLLGYGDITIETAGEEENFVFNQVPKPQALADEIMQAHEALADSNPAQAAQV